MKELIVMVGSVLLAVYIFGMMITDDNSLYKTSEKILIETKEAVLCTS